MHCLHTQVTLVVHPSPAPDHVIFNSTFICSSPYFKHSIFSPLGAPRVDTQLHVQRKEIVLQKLFDKCRMVLTVLIIQQNKRL